MNEYGPHPQDGIMRNLAMLGLLLNLLASLRSALRTRGELALENLALRQQLGTLHRSTPRVRLGRADRAFWIGLSQIWSRWVLPKNKRACGREQDLADLKILERISGADGGSPQ